MPYCKKCGPSEYNSQYNQTACEKCPSGYFSRRGSISKLNCTQQTMPCSVLPPICGSNGQCQSVAESIFLYTCLCEDDFMGSHCEIQQDSCASAPCYNGGICKVLPDSSIFCECPESYFGQFCELFKDPCNDNPCKNAGVCIEIDGKAICECPNEYEGQFCEIHNNYCGDSPCVRGNCESKSDGFECICPPGYIGRRCHLKPCDYLPCNGSAICVDISEGATTKGSFRYVYC